MRRNHIFIVLMITVLVLSACAGVAEKSEIMQESVVEEMSPEPMAETEGDTSVASDSMDDESMDEMSDTGPDAMNQDGGDDLAETPSAMEEPVVHNVSMLPNWFSMSLVDVNTGQEFKVGDFKGKVVLVETIAMWCSTCLRQQKEVLALHDVLGDSDHLVSLTLDIDPNEIAQDLETYTQNYGFYWIYAVAPVEVSRQISELYGDNFLNPPSAPMFIIDSDGEVHPLRFGVKDANELLESLKPFLDEVK